MNPLYGAALISGGIQTGGSIISSALNFKAAADTRSWQERMDSSKYQRSVADLRAAGLNPILAAGGGIGGGSVPTPPTPEARIDTSALAEGLNSASRLKHIDQKRVENETRSTDATVKSAEAVQNLHSAQAAKTQVEAAVLAKEVDLKAAHTILANAQTALTHATARNVRAETPKKELSSKAWQAAHEAVKDPVGWARGTRVGKAIQRIIRPGDAYALGHGNVNGGLHSAHQYRNVRGTHERGRDLGVEKQHNRQFNKRFNQ